MKTDCINRKGIVLEGGHLEHSPKTVPDTISARFQGMALGRGTRLTEFGDSTKLKTSSGQEFTLLPTWNLGLD